MKQALTFYVNPKIPEKLKMLQELSNNLWSTWDKKAYRLFSRIDPIAFRQCKQNPVKLLHEVSETRLADLAEDKGFLAEMKVVYKSFQDYLNFTGSYKDKDGNKINFNKDDIIAYFSMEYGLHESIPIYSGGLGVLSGDHMKAASDLAAPVIGFGLLYKFGYFSQFINTLGEQQEEWKENQWHLMPVSIMNEEQEGDSPQQHKLIKINIAGNDIYIKIWTITVGQIKLYLLDTDIPDNSQFHRSITDKLYDADRDIRILQEIVLSIGAMELMRSLNIKPKVYHLNEGHSAFVIIERLRQLITEENYSFSEAQQLIANSTVFTTHTPVTEGNEHFRIDLVKKYLSDRIEKTGLSLEQFTQFASIPGDTSNFWLPALALRFSRFANAVSKMHADTSRSLWAKIFPNLNSDEIPIGYVTNGVHTPSWLSRELTILFDRYLGEEYYHKTQEASLWQNIRKIPDIEIWEAHQRRKEQMISFIRQKIEQSILEERAFFNRSNKLRHTLSPDILTIGFARRFAPYKRANLILSDPERLLSIINNPLKPVQFVIAGKAHPADTEGKKLIKNLVDFAKNHNIEDRFVFIEDYDINVAKYIVQGVDVWLNTPIRPFEASGTSGMKAGLNGVLNLSVLDGWWPECYNGENGWSVTTGEGIFSQEVNNYLEVQHIYDLLEGEISDLYYRRDESNLPYGWLQKMKNSIYTVGMGFNMNRMLQEYTNDYYLPAINATNELTKNKNKLLVDMIKTENELNKYWKKVSIKDTHIKIKDIPVSTSVTVNSGDIVSVNCYVNMDNAPQDLFGVELLYQDGSNKPLQLITLKFEERYKDNVARYYGEFSLSSSGLQSINIRVRGIVHPYYQNSHNFIKE